MRVRLVAPPWGAPRLTKEAQEMVDVLADGVWSEAAVSFYAERDAKIRAGKRAPKGMQKTLNQVIEKRMIQAGWEGDSGYYFKGRTWVRVTFRHQMSLGSDFVDALKVCKKEGMELAIILAANRDTLRTISPNDCNALVSFEKLQTEAVSLDGALDIPLVIGSLTPASEVASAIEDELRKARLRDTTVPTLIQRS